MPTARARKTTSTALRISPEDLERIDSIAAQFGVSRSAWMIEAALNYDPSFGAGQNDKEPPADVSGRLEAIEKRLAALEGNLFNDRPDWLRSGKG